MGDQFTKYQLISLGWLLVILALIGVVLPILPTTPLLILAMVLFSKSSPRFHQMLRNNSLIGPSLRRWEASKTMARKDKIMATVAIFVTFSISITLVRDTPELQIMLLCIAIVLLFFMWRIKETA
jgi:uncharacterized membrane protein YbaN (DUF454 family)